MIRKQSTRRRPIAAMLVAAIVCFSSDRGSSVRGDEPATDALADAADPYAAAKEAFDAHRWADATRLIRTALKAAPDDPRAAPIRMYLAESLSNELRYEDAAKEYRGFLKSATDRGVATYARFRLIQNLHFASDKDAVIAEAVPFLEEHPLFEEAAEVWFYLGSANFPEDSAAAEAAFARITAQYPEHRRAATAIPFQAMCLLNLGRPEVAWTVICPHLPPANAADTAALQLVAGQTLTALGEQAMAAEKWDDAERHFDRLLLLLPTSGLAAHAAVRRAEIAYDRGDFPVAVKRYDAVLGRSDLPAEDAPGVSYGLISSHAQLQQWDDVVRLADAAKTKHADWPHVYEFDYLRGRALFAKAELNAARAAFAVVTSNAAARDTETWALAQFMTAEAYSLQRNFESALAAYELAASSPLAEWKLSARMACGKLREHLGRYAEAVRDYERITQEFAAAPEAEEAERRRAACLAQAAAKQNLERK